LRFKNEFIVSFITIVGTRSFPVGTCPHVVSVRLYVPFARPHFAAAGLLLWARRTGDIDRCCTALSSGGATAQRATADAGSATLSANVGS